MAVDPLAIVRAFAEFAGLAAELVDRFAEANPELIEPSGDPSTGLSPTDDLDPEVRRRIEAGEL